MIVSATDLLNGAEMSLKSSKEFCNHVEGLFLGVRPYYMYIDSLKFCTCTFHHIK